MPRRPLLVVAAAVALALGIYVWLGSRSTPKRDATSVAGTTSARAGLAGNQTRGVGLSFLAQRNAPARRLAGRVVFEGEPVAGATVRLAGRLRRDVVLASATTGGDGAFDFGPQDAALFFLSASADGKAGVVLPIDLRNPAMRPPFDAVVLELRPCAASVYGFVLDASSGPIPGAIVRRGPIDVVAASDGAYSLCVPIGEANLEVGADGYGTIAVALPVTNRFRRDFRLSPEGVVVGRAVRADDGKPVADALVTVRPMGSDMPNIGGLRAADRRATTDADGRFRVAGILPGRSQASAMASGLRSPDIDVNVEAGDANEELAVALEPTVVVQGRVVDEAGAGVQGATITLGDDERARWVDDAVPGAVSQLDGNFVIDGMRPGTYLLDLAPFRATKSTPRSLDVPAAGLTGLSFVVARGSTISGMVTREGKPIGGARVYVQSGGRMQALSSADGSFQLRGIEPGTHEIYAENIQHGAFNRGPTVTVEEGKDVTGVAVDLSLAGSIAGVVVDQHGAPVSGAFLSFKLVSGGDYGESTTAEDGTFEARALSGGGDYGVSITASRSSSMQFLPVDGDELAPVAVADGNTHVTGVRYQVTVDRLSISGKVVDEQGQPVPDVRVEASLHGERGWDRGEIPSSVTDADGAFAITNLLAGEYHVDARAGNGAEAAAPKPVDAGARNVTITLKTPGTIEGSIEGFPKPPRVSARLFRRGEMPSAPYTAAVTGTTFRLRGLPPGPYMVSALDGGVVVGREAVEVKAGQVAKTALTYRGIGSVEGTVVDSTGKPARAQCSMGDFGGTRMTASSDDRGAFAFKSAPVGEQRVSCFAFSRSMEDSTMGFGAVTVVAGETAKVTITVAVRERPKPTSTIGATFARTPAGPRVATLVDGGPAARAGMKVRDLVVNVSELDFPLRNVDDEMMNEIIGEMPPGSTLTFKVRRGTETLDISVTVAAIAP